MLKDLAVGLLRSRGMTAAIEVPCPVPRYRADAAGAGPAPSCGSQPWETAIIECKASRADFLRDAGTPVELARAVERLRLHRAEFRRLDAAAMEPALRRAGTALWPELAEWDWSRSELKCARVIDGALAGAERRLAESTKLRTLARWALARELYLLTPAGMIDAAEVPPGWGLLEARGTDVRVALPAPIHRPGVRWSRRLAAKLAARAAGEDGPRPSAESECGLLQFAGGCVGGV